MDLNKLSLGEKIVGGAAIVFIISTFLPWFTARVSFMGVSRSESGNGWDVGFLWGRLPALIALVMIIVIVVDKFTGTELPSVPVGWGAVHLGLGALIALLVILKLIIGEDTGLSAAEEAMLAETDYGIDRAWGLFVAAIAAIGIAVGGFFMFNEEKAGGGPSTAPPQTF